MTAAPMIDLNSDLGESYTEWRRGNDEAILDVVTSANIACGFHAGDPMTIEATIKAAVSRGVSIGAHPAYPDLAGFGRRTMHMAPGEVEATVLYQIGALEVMTRANGARMSHVKPHGALYNDAANDRPLADAIASAVRRAGGLRLVGPPASALADAAAAAKIPFLAEAFCDRAYGSDGRIISRSLPNALIVDPKVAAQQAVDIASRHRVRTAAGVEITVAAATLCIHGDTPGALRIAETVRNALERAGVRIAPPE